MFIKALIKQREEDPMEEEIVVSEESQAWDNSNLDEEFGMHDILH